MTLRRHIWFHEGGGLHRYGVLIKRWYGWKIVYRRMGWIVTLRFIGEPDWSDRTILKSSSGRVTSLSHSPHASSFRLDTQ